MRGIGSAVVAVVHVLELLVLERVEDLEVLMQVVVKDNMRAVQVQIQSL